MTVYIVLNHKGGPVEAFTTYEQADIATRQYNHGFGANAFSFTKMMVKVSA